LSNPERTRENTSTSIALLKYARDKKQGIIEKLIAVLMQLGCFKARLGYFEMFQSFYNNTIRYTDAFALTIFKENK